MVQHELFNWVLRASLPESFGSEVGKSRARFLLCHLQDYWGGTGMLDRLWLRDWQSPLFNLLFLLAGFGLPTHNEVMSLVCGKETDGGNLYWDIFGCLTKVLQQELLRPRQIPWYNKTFFCVFASHVLIPPSFDGPTRQNLTLV